MNGMGVEAWSSFNAFYFFMSIFFLSFFFIIIKDMFNTWI